MENINNQSLVEEIVQGKDTKINPEFSVLTAEDLANAFEVATQKAVEKNQRTIINQLTKKFEPLDFQSIAYPQTEKLYERLEELTTKLTLPDGSLNKDKDLENERTEWKNLDKQLQRLKVTHKHLIILAIDEVLKTALNNEWGLCRKHNFIYLYNSEYWQEIDKDLFQSFLGEVAEKMGIDKLISKHFQFREHLFKQFIATAYLPSPEPDNSKVFVNLINGTFEITPQDTKLRPFNQTDFITYQLPFEYNPQATAPLFEKYLNQVLPDKDRQKVLAEYIGYLFIKHGSKTLKEEKALILYGTGANGKSVFFEIINALLGMENVSNYSLQALTDDNGYYRAKIANKLVNYASEIGGHKINSEIFKKMTSGEPLEARLPYGEPFQPTQYAKLIFNCNELPKDVEHTNAYFRRFLIIPFDVTIPENEQDKELHIKIIDKELSGVFNWVLEGLNRLLVQKKFTECTAVQQALEKYKLESDSVLMFIDELGYKKSISNEIPLKDLYYEYKSYCFESGYKQCSNRTFSERLKNKGFMVERKNHGRIVNIQKK